MGLSVGKHKMPRSAHRQQVIGANEIRKGVVSEKLDEFEESARIVEAFIAGGSDDEAELLERVAAAIRDRGIDD